MSKNEKVHIIIDNREKKLEIAIKNVSQIIEYEMQQLDVADIVISENVACERKEGFDFISSIMDNRLFEQLLRLKEAYQNPILILEGLNSEVFENVGMNIRSIYGALAFISYKLKIAIIPTRNIEDTVIVIERIAYREQIKDESPVLSRSAPKNMNIEERRCYIIEGLLDIGPRKAKQLIEEFKTPYEVFKAIKNTELTYTKNNRIKGLKGPLEKVKGIGPKFILKNKKILFNMEDNVRTNKEIESSKQKTLF
ncbi:MAG: hypothetical protein KGD57_07470 [Candidatus Lokiarchaeota archaeon]|nr:hypothetical protein [Candidatus Lokiarchaeota archaeon]